VKAGFVFNGRHLPYNEKLIERAKVLRANMTPAEKLLWQNFLQNFRPRFRRQRPIDNYIADFYCAQAKLIIEIDGSSHNTTEILDNDSERTRILGSYGLEVIRFTNSEVTEKIRSVCEQIEKRVLARLGDKSKHHTLALPL
jgi:very-short-patch-repair endonuclease